MAWDNIDDLWWLRPTPEQAPFLPAAIAGVNIRHQAVMEKIDQQNASNNQIRTLIDLQEHQAKMQLQNKIAMGQGKLAKVMADISDWSDPEQMQKIYQIGVENPELVGSPAWNGVEKMHENAVSMSIRKQQVEAQRDIAEARSRDINRRIDVIEKAGVTREEDKMAIAEIRDATERARIATTHEDKTVYQTIAMEKLAAYEGLKQQQIIESQARTQVLRDKAKSLASGLDAGQRAKMNIEFKAIEDRFIYGTGKGRMTPEQHEKAIDDLIDKYTPDSELLPPGSPPPAGAPVAPTTAPPTPTVGTKTLTEALARDFLKKAGGDKEKARQLAREAGYIF